MNATGRYLSPEPLLQSPNWVASQLRSGRQVPAYAYAANNPIANIDANGLETLVLYGDPGRFAGSSFNFNSPGQQAAYELGLRQFFLANGMESSLDQIVALHLSGPVSPGAFALGPNGQPWTNVVYFGHGDSSFLWPGSSFRTAIAASSFSSSLLSSWASTGDAPLNVHILGCDAGGRDSRFRQRLQFDLPYSRIHGHGGARVPRYDFVNGIPIFEAVVVTSRRWGLALLAGATLAACRRAEVSPHANADACHVLTTVAASRCYQRLLGACNLPTIPIHVLGVDGGVCDSGQALAEAWRLEVEAFQGDGGIGWAGSVLRRVVVDGHQMVDAKFCGLCSSETEPQSAIPSTLVRPE